MSATPQTPDDADLIRRCTDLVDDSPYAAARAEARELGAGSPDALGADALGLVTRLIGVRAAVCIAQAPGVPALAVLDSSPTAIVTCIADDPHHLDVARSSLRTGGHPSSSARFISARPTEVLGKLADGAYDLVYAEAPESETATIVDRARQLLRRGGALVLAGLRTEAVAASGGDPGDDAGAVRASVLPVSGGLTVVTFG